MLRLLYNRKGQNMAEYAIIFGVVIAAAVGISALIKEGIQDRVVSEVRKIGDDEPLTVGPAFDLIAVTQRTRDVDQDDIVIEKGGAVTEDTHAKTTLEEGYEEYNVGN